MTRMVAPFIALCRHRLTTDGGGVTTLAAFHGCPLRCKYCLNRQCWESAHIWRELSVEELVEETMADDLYFQATGGGICFGGGEPLLWSAFIEAFAKRCPPEWHIYLETSLNVPLPTPGSGGGYRSIGDNRGFDAYIHHYYIDVKDMNPDIYRRYTGRDNSQMLHNLDWFSRQGLQQKVTIRLPLIPGFNTDADRQQSRQQLEALGFTDFDLFDYIRYDIPCDSQ